MTLIIGAMPDSHWEQLAPLMKQLGWQAQEKNPEAWYQVQETSSDSFAANRHLLLHSRPEVVVANAMYVGKDPVEALNRWKTSAEHLLGFYKHNRHQSLLLEVESILQYPQICLEEVCKHFEFEVERTPINLDTTSKIPPNYQLLANQFVAQANLPVNILPELQACTFPLSDESYTAPKLNITELHQGLLAWSQVEKQSNKVLMDIKEENTLLLEQLHRVQEELEVYYLKNKDKSSEVKNLVAQLKEKEKKLQDNGITIRKVQESNGKLKKSLENANRKQRSAQAAMDRLRNSTSWKITAPIRMLKMAVPRKKNK